MHPTYGESYPCPLARYGRRHGRAAAAASPDPGGTAARRRRRGALDPVLAEYPSRAVSTENPHSPLRSDLGMQAARAAATARAGVTAEPRRRRARAQLLKADALLALSSRDIALRSQILPRIAARPHRYSERR